MLLILRWLLKERIQVYFIDNDEYFKGKQHLQMKRVMYADNDDAIFFAKGVETVKKKRKLMGSRYHSCSWLDGSYVTNIHETLL
jgi:starch synthase